MNNIKKINIFFFNTLFLIFLTVNSFLEAKDSHNTKDTIHKNKKNADAQDEAEKKEDSEKIKSQIKKYLNSDAGKKLIKNSDIDIDTLALAICEHMTLINNTDIAIISDIDITDNIAAIKTELAAARNEFSNTIERLQKQNDTFRRIAIFLGICTIGANNSISMYLLLACLTFYYF
jgi:hypothetical protein